LAADGIGSEDYFEAHSGNPRDYVTALFTDVLGRAPTEAEVQRWSDRFFSSGNGVVMAREFLIFAQSELATRPYPPYDPWCRPPHDPCRGRP
jgi:hypothetical protein